MSKVIPIPSLPIALVVSEFNQEITAELQRGALQRLQEYGIREEHITVISVPGAIEIPLATQALARREHFHAIITLGAVIRGETSHYDYVCEQVSQGCLCVSLDHHLPVIFGVLTTENLEQARQRAGGKKGHKGVDAADAAIKMIQQLDRIEASMVTGGIRDEKRQ